MHWIYLIHEFQNLSWITEINELFHDILIYWDAPVNAVLFKLLLTKSLLFNKKVFYCTFDPINVALVSIRDFFQFVLMIPNLVATQYAVPDTNNNTMICIVARWTGVLYQSFYCFKMGHFGKVLTSHPGPELSVSWWYLSYHLTTVHTGL